MPKQVAASLRATAFHEAGHAVAAFALGRPVKQASIVPEKGTLGHVRLGGRNQVRRMETTALGFRARYRVERDLMGTLAGPEAERRATGRGNNIGARFDHAYVADVALSFAQGHEKEGTPTSAGLAVVRSGW